MSSPFRSFATSVKLPLSSVPLFAQLAGGLTQAQNTVAQWINARRKAATAASIAADGSRFVHETLLPFLNSRPLMANVDSSKADWTPLPAGGAAAAPSHVVMEATRHVLRGCGFNAQLASQIILMVRSRSEPSSGRATRHAHPVPTQPSTQPPSAHPTQRRPNSAPTHPRPRIPSRRSCVGHCSVWLSQI